MQCVVLKRIDENPYPTHWRQTCALMGLHHEVRQLISNIIQKLIKLKKIKFITVWFFSQVWNKQWINKSIGLQFQKGHWYSEKCHDLSQIKLLESDKYYRKIGSETEVIRSIQLILNHLLAVSHRFEQLQCKSDVQKHFSNDLYAFWMIFIKTWFRLTTWGAGSPVELETFIITTRSNQPHSWAWESCETKTR